ncbi:ceramide synthase 5-like isoform X1 [Salvelinus alpinus]|uniref:ceramide synthase 5-like isoform X1 n=1 Tax=Salvelinus alpinus TaxID=8036 RepID=UPI0039FD8D77
MAALSVWFWNERFWLPHNVTWADLADPAPGVEYPKAGHLLSALPLAVGIFAVRILFERFIASPCAFLLHIHAASVHWRATPNPVLEKVFTSITKCPDSRHLDGLSKQLDWDVRKVQRWFRHRRNQDKPSILTKFCESIPSLVTSLSTWLIRVYIVHPRWRLIFYLFMFTYGICFLWKCSWMWDTHHCWYNYPYQVLTPGLYHYYVTELGFYWSLMFSQFTDIKRKDFPIMFIHHLATVSLISFSYANNMLRVGSLVMCVHDASDFLLEAAKLANYAKYQHLCDFLFVLFAVVFFITRLVLYPLWILNTTLFESWEIIGPYPSWWLFNSLLLVLQVLHVIWSYLIAGIAYKALVRGKVSKDDRSDVESSSEEEVDTNGTNGRGVNMVFSRKVENGTNGHAVTTITWPQQIRSSSSSR